MVLRFQDGSQLFGQQDVRELGEGTEVIIGGFDALATGTFTLQTTSTSYGTNYTDVPIGAADLTSDDMIVVEMTVQNGSNKSILMRIGTTGTTTAAPCGAATVTTGNDAFCTFKMTQSKSDTSIALFQETAITGAPVFTGLVSAIETDTDVFLTTAFSVRVEARYNAEADQASSIGFVVYKVRM